MIRFRNGYRHLLAGRHLEKRPGALVRSQQRIDLLPQLRVAGARPIQIRGTLGQVGDIERGQKDVLFRHGAASHEYSGCPTLLSLSAKFRG